MTNFTLKTYDTGFFHYYSPMIYWTLTYPVVWYANPESLLELVSIVNTLSEPDLKLFFQGTLN